MMQNYCKNYQRKGENPFAVIPWNEDFLYKIQELVDTLMAEQHISMQDIVLVFPNARPKRYLTSRYKKLAKEKKQVSILPQIYTNKEFYKLCLQHFERGQSLFSELEPLDRYAKLHEIVKSVLQDNESLHFSSSMDVKSMQRAKTNAEALKVAKFYSWAKNLDDLFEECFENLVLPQRVEYADEVPDFAKSLLEEIEEIFAGYMLSMQENRQTTPAYSLFRTAKYVQAYSAYQRDRTPDMDFPIPLNNMDYKVYFADFMPCLFQGKCIIFAGFVYASKAEEVILRYFWEHGACICLNTDSRLVTDMAHLHYSCEDHKKWLQKWQAEAVLLCDKKETKPNIKFLPAYDFHSQLEVLKKDIRPYLDPNEERDDYCAVVLPNPSLLMPVLHELPNKNINISLGYPIQRTLLWQFIVHIFNLQINKKEAAENKYSYKVEDLLALLQHPYTKMLLSYKDKSAENLDSEQSLCTEENFTTWRKVLYYAEKQLQEKNVYVDFEDFVGNDLFDLDNANIPYELNKDMTDFVDHFFSLTVSSWEQTETLHAVGTRLNELMIFLIRHGLSVWYRFPLDKEGLVRFMQNTIPMLMQNGFADSEFPFKTLYEIMKQCIADERVPFEADPLMGLQVLGVLETRLLSFENLFIMDCVESVLPAAHMQSLLVPDILRPLLGLPDGHSREFLMAHIFYRLIHSAKNVYFYWQEGVQSSEIQSSKNIRSRFIEELIWEKEKALLAEGKANNLEEADNFILHYDSSCNPFVPDRRKKRGIEITDTIFSALEKSICKESENSRRGLSATGLNAYLKCPVRFYYEYLAKISEPEKKELGDNKTAFGDEMHKLLKNLHPLNRIIKKEEHETFAEQLVQQFYQTFNADTWQNYFSADSYFMLQETGEFFLRKYVEEMPDQVEIIATEQELSHELTHEAFSLPVHLYGKADRIDKRGDNYFIVDYKTTARNKKQIPLWKNAALLEELGDMNKAWQEKKADFCLEKLYNQMEDTQLPFYLYLFAQDQIHTKKILDKQAHINASWIFLSEREKKKSELVLIDEKYAGGEDMWKILQTVRENYMDIVLHFILNHMAKEKVWKCKEGKYCGYCPYAEYC